MARPVYEDYCQWCRRLGIEPASFTGWATGAGSHFDRRDLGRIAPPIESYSNVPKKRSHIGLFALAAIILILAILAMRSPTATCADGALSYSGHDQGTCSWHGGVKAWGR